MVVLQICQNPENMIMPASLVTASFEISSYNIVYAEYYANSGLDYLWEERLNTEAAVERQAAVADSFELQSS